MNPLMMVRLVSADDWQGFYLNGKLVMEKHSLSAYHVLQALSKLCEIATVEAYERLGGKNVESLEMADFVAAFDFLLKNDPRMKGVNPFKVDDRRKIPTFPLTPPETEDDSDENARKARSPRRKARSPRSTVGGLILAKS